MFSKKEFNELEIILAVYSIIVAAPSSIERPRANDILKSLISNVLFLN